MIYLQCLLRRFEKCVVLLLLLNGFLSNRRRRKLISRDSLAIIMIGRGGEQANEQGEVIRYWYTFKYFTDGFKTLLGTLKQQ